MPRHVDCKRFREEHATFVDLMCSAVEENEMRRHLRRCPQCAHHDMLVRRSLMLVKSLPMIEPSPDFRARLESRLRTVSPATSRKAARISYAPVLAVAAAMAFMAFLAIDGMRHASLQASQPIRLAPVVASVPDFEASPVASPALVATVPTGMSVWPAIVVASQTPTHFVAAEMATER
jgi:hypothetical protein